MHTRERERETLYKHFAKNGSVEEEIKRKENQ